jgi:hypothetical protein
MGVNMFHTEMLDNSFVEHLDRWIPNNADDFDDFLSSLKRLAKDEAILRALSVIGRRAFLKLSLEERRRIMAEQAEKMAQYYEQDQEWKELQGGDIVEY